MKRRTPQRREEERESGGERGGRKKFACFLTLAGFYLCGISRVRFKVASMHAGARVHDTERLYNYNAQLIKEKEYNRFQMNLCD